MNKQIFRQKNIDRLASPEEMNDYIRVITPSVWFVLMAIIILLAGFIVWAIFGQIPSVDAAGNVTYLHPITYILN